SRRTPKAASSCGSPIPTATHSSSHPSNSCGFDRHNSRGQSMDRLKGKVALISGGARGQGAAEARQFANEGAKVVIGAVLDKATRKTADGINAKFGSKVVIPVHLDVTSAADWRAAVETCERDFGGLDILINNAGIANVKGLEETTEADWDAVININQKGVWL